MLDKRKKGFEDKFALDGELQFKVRARRNKLMGLWVASQLGYDEEKAKAYALEIVDEDLKKPGDSDVIDRIRHDLTTAGVPADDKQLNKKLIECENEAKKQLLGQ